MLASWTVPAPAADCYFIMQVLPFSPAEFLGHYHGNFPFLEIAEELQDSSFWDVHLAAAPAPSRAWNHQGGAPGGAWCLPGWWELGSASPGAAIAAEPGQVRGDALRCAAHR